VSSHFRNSILFYFLSRPTINLEDLENEQKKYFESEVLKQIIADSPMYFV